MIYEVAIDPSVMKSWAKNRRDYKEFFRTYNQGCPRIISSFPKRKFSKLRSYLLKCKDTELDDMASKRYDAMIDSLENNLFCRDCQIETDDDWYHLIAKEEIPPDFTVSSKELPMEGFIYAEELYESKLLEIPTQISFKRNKEDFIQAIKGLLHSTYKEILIIDPYAYKKNSLYTITEIIKELNQRKTKSTQIKITIIYKGKEYNDNSIPASLVLQDLNKLISIPEKITVSFYQLKEIEDKSSALHNRYILNETRGVMLGHGLDFPKKNTNQTDEIILLNDNNYHKIKNRFSIEPIESCEFEVVSHA